MEWVRHFCFKEETLKWLIIQSDGSHKGQDGWTPNWYLRECYSIKHALKQNGIDSDIWGSGHDNFLIMPNFDEYDSIFCIENYDFSWLPNLSSVKCPKIYWTIDLHCQDMSIYANVIRDFDIVLHSTKSLIPLLKNVSSNKKHIYFPNGFDDRYFRKNSVTKTRDFVFVGSKNPARKEFIERLERDCSLNYFFATGQDMIDIISSSKIHFNHSISCDVNYRNFETIGLGCCLLTNKLDELQDLGFVDGENCLLYDSYEEAVEKYREAIRNNLWIDIGKKSLLLAEKHSYSCRVKELLKNELF